MSWTYQPLVGDKSTDMSRDYARAWLPLSQNGFPDHFSRGKYPKVSVFEPESPFRMYDSNNIAEKAIVHPALLHTTPLIIQTYLYGGA
jgi:hypothetical protein